MKENPEIAFYYPNPMWRNSDWIKNLILFFDGIGLLVPEYMKDRIESLDPSIVSGLNEFDLLHIIEPEEAIDASSTEMLVSILTDVIVSGTLDILAKNSVDFQYLSNSRLGFHGDYELAEMIFEELKKRGLAKDSEDDKTILLHPMVRSLILTLLSQIVRPYGDKIKLDLNPVTDRHRLIGSLKEMLSIPNSPSSGNVISFDLNVVSVDVSAIPFDDVLAFREENFKFFKEYQRECKLFAFELSSMNQEERNQYFEIRQEKLNDIASDLRKISRKAWKKPSSFALTIAGGAWALATGDIIGGAIAASGSLLGIDKDHKEIGAYSYLFKANEKW